MSTFTSSSTTVRARVYAHLAQHGPNHREALAQALGISSDAVRNALGRMQGVKDIEALGLPRQQPQWYGVTGDARGAAKREALLKAAQEKHQHAPPSPEDVRVNTRRAAQRVLPLITEKGLSEVQLTKELPDMPISLLRSALQWLIGEGTIVKSDSNYAGSRYLYRLDVVEFPEAPEKIRPEHRRVEQHLMQVSSAGTCDTVPYMSTLLRLSREEVMRALSWLHTEGRLRWRRVGELPLFRLDLNAGEVAA